MAGADFFRTGHSANEKSMKAALTLAGFILLAGLQPASAAYSVALNGIASLFSHKLATLVLGRGENYPPTGFTLAEGESQFGIKLLAVDAAGQRVQIEQHGKKIYLRLTGAAAMTGGATVEVTVKSAAPAPGEWSVESYLNSEAVRRIQAGQTPWPTTIAGGNPARTAAENSDATPDKSNFNPAPVAATATAAADFTKELWYQDSLVIEQQRAATVAAVLAGDKTPWPRTPLTPPGTPSRLLDRETIYGDHIPGLRPYGFVD